MPLLCAVPSHSLSFVFLAVSQKEVPLPEKSFGLPHSYNYSEVGVVAVT